MGFWLEHGIKESGSDTDYCIKARVSRFFEFPGSREDGHFYSSRDQFNRRLYSPVRLEPTHCLVVYYIHALFKVMDAPQNDLGSD